LRNEIQKKKKKQDKSEGQKKKNAQMFELFLLWRFLPTNWESEREQKLRCQSTYLWSQAIYWFFMEIVS